MNNLSSATHCYEFQLNLTNERVFESFNESLPEKLQVIILFNYILHYFQIQIYLFYFKKKFESFALSGLKHYSMVAKQFQQLFAKIPKQFSKISKVGLFYFFVLGPVNLKINLFILGIRGCQ